MKKAWKPRKNGKNERKKDLLAMGFEPGRFWQKV